MKIKEQKAIKLSIATLDNPRTENVDNAFRRFVDSINNHKYARTNELVSETRGDFCLHKNCVGCKNGTCSGMHMISCPCRSCSVWC